MRLRPFTTILPKPLLPIGDRPILEIILRQLADAGFTKIDLCVGHLGELIRVYFSEGTVMPDGLELGWHWEPEEPLGTADVPSSVFPLLAGACWTAVTRTLSKTSWVLMACCAAGSPWVT